MNTEIARFVSNQRKLLKMTQPMLAQRAGVGLRFIRDLEQGKTNLRTDKVESVLQLFGHTLGPVAMLREHHD